MRYFPLFLDLRGRLVVVVGGGAIAERKIALFREAGARLRVVALRLTPALADLAIRGELEHRLGEFSATDLDGARIAVAATDQRATNRLVADAAEARGIYINVVDDLELSTAILPAIVDRSPLVVAISTQGTTPALARLVREQIEGVVDGAAGRLAEFCAAWRDRIKSGVQALPARRQFYDWLLRGPVARLVRSAREVEAGRLVAATLADGVAAPVGSVVLVGAGPGDPGLLTVRGLRELQAADVVLHDRLVSAQILALARREAELIAVGKAAGGHSVSQARIHELMLEHARKGRRVVRLKGGDPFIFGRGGEELEFLASRGVGFEVVPGITAALGCAAYAGIPLTHRDHSASVRFITAHCRESVEAIDWRSLARERETLAVYMGVALVGTLRDQLLRLGRAPSTPIAFIESGSRPEQRVLVGTLAGSEALAAAHGLSSPALLVIGGVASLARALHWFGAAPLGMPALAERTAA